MALLDSVENLAVGQYVTIEQAKFKDMETGNWLGRGWGAFWLGPGNDPRGDTFRVVHVELPLVILDWLVTNSGQQLRPPARVVLDTRFITFRELSQEFAAAMLNRVQQSNMPDPEEQLAKTLAQLTGMSKVQFPQLPPIQDEQRLLEEKLRNKSTKKRNKKNHGR